MPVMSVQQQRTLHDHRYHFESCARKQREAPRIVGIVGSPFDVDPGTVEVRRVIDENHLGSLRYVSVAEKTNLLAARSHVHRYFSSDLLQIFRDVARHAVQRNYHEDRNALSRLNVGKSLNGFREPAGSRVRCVFRSEVNHTHGVAR